MPTRQSYLLQIGGTTVVNSEELELSLRNEFDSYLKNVLAGIREDVSEFQKKFELEFEKHRSQLDEAMRGLSERFESETTFDKAFVESVSEHLRLARDEGALITATAFSEAEKLVEEASSTAHMDYLRDAINDISKRSSQSDILRALIGHAAHFTPRGAFFIVKNEQFVGWKVFGSESSDDTAVREVQFPASSQTLLADAVDSLQTRESSYGTYAEDDLFIEALDFGRPDKMFAIPLVARGRGVAVLYADYGKEGVSMHSEALEMLVRVAGLTVELLASAQAAPVAAKAADTVESGAGSGAEAANHKPAEELSAADAYDAYDEHPAEDTLAEEATEQQDIFTRTQEFAYDDISAGEPVSEEAEESVETYEIDAADSGYEAISAFDEVAEVETASTSAPAFEMAADEPAAAEETAPESDYYETFRSMETPASEVEGSPAIEIETTHSYSNGYSNGNGHTAPVEVESFAPPAEPETEPETAAETQGGEPEEAEAVETIEETVAAAPAFQPAEPVVEVAGASPRRSRFADRNVDLPIEVSEDERGPHNSARRFARLLVSEIKLYNGEKVAEGLEAGDLYDRLREAVDRSREMYDKRVDPAVSAKFDYFNYELVNSLANGSEEKLGGNYRGAAVK